MVLLEREEHQELQVLQEHQEVRDRAEHQEVQGLQSTHRYGIAVTQVSGLFIQGT